MYEDLLRIKAFREQTAASAVLRQRRVLEEQTQTLRQARKAVIDFRNYRVNKERQLFENIKGRSVAVRAIETMKQNVAALREKEAGLESQILAAEKQVKEAQQALEEARQQHAETVRAHEKFGQFIAVQQETERLEQTRREENELEETVSAGRPHGNPMIE